MGAHGLAMVGVAFGGDFINAAARALGSTAAFAGDPLLLAMACAAGVIFAGRWGYLAVAAVAIAVVTGLSALPYQHELGLGYSRFLPGLPMRGMAAFLLMAVVTGVMLAAEAARAKTRL